MIRRLIVGLVVLSLVGAGTAGAYTSGQPVIRVALSDHTVQAGETTTLELTVANEGELDRVEPTMPGMGTRVTTARGVSVDLRSGDAPVTVETGSRLVGSLPEGSSTGLPFRVHVDEDAAPGVYDVPVVVSYTYSDFVSDDGIAESETERVRTTVQVRVESAPRFEVVDARADVRAGESGTVAVTLDNVGTAAAQNATVTLASATEGLRFGASGASQTELAVGDWNRSDRRTLTYRVQVADSDTAQNYSLHAQVTYRDDEGNREQSQSRSVLVSPTPTPIVDVQNVSSTLGVGERGTIAGTVVNRGPSTIDDAAVVLDTGVPSVTPVRTERPVGTLEPGAAASFSFDVDVADRVDPGDRLVAFQAEYDANRGRVASDRIAVQIPIEAEQEPFQIRVRNGTTAPDTDNYRYVVEVTNVGEVPRRNVVYSLRTAPPLSSATPTVSGEDLGPGETARVAFDLSVGEDAVEATYPVWVNVTADTPAREDSVDGPYQVPMRVEEVPADQTNVSILAVGAFVAVLVVVGLWWWLRA